MLQEMALVASSHTPHKAPASSSRTTSSIGSLTEIWLKYEKGKNLSGQTDRVATDTDPSFTLKG